MISLSLLITAYTMYIGTICSILGPLSISVLVYWSILIYRWVVSCTQTASRCCCDVTAGCTRCQTFSELSKYYYWGTAAHCRPNKYDICLLVLLLPYRKKIFVRTEKFPCFGNDESALLNPLIIQSSHNIEMINVFSLTYLNVSFIFFSVLRNCWV